MASRKWLRMGSQPNPSVHLPNDHQKKEFSSQPVLNRSNVSPNAPSITSFIDSIPPAQNHQFKQTQLSQYPIFPQKLMNASKSANQTLKNVQTTTPLNHNPPPKEVTNDGTIQSNSKATTNQEELISDEELKAVLGIWNEKSVDENPHSGKSSPHPFSASQLRVDQLEEEKRGWEFEKSEMLKEIIEAQESVQYLEEKLKEKTQLLRIQSEDLRVANSKIALNRNELEDSEEYSQIAETLITREDQLNSMKNGSKKHRIEELQSQMVEIMKELDYLRSLPD